MNKNKVLIISFSLLLLVGLSACQGQPAANTPPGADSAKTGTDQSSTSPSSSTSNASVSVNPATNADGTSAATNASATIVPADGKANPSTTAPAAAAEPPAEIKELLKMQDQLSTIVKSGDISKCKDLGMTQYVMSCEINVMLSSAKSKDDTAVCDKASTKDIKDQCLMLLKNMPAKK